MASRRVLEDLLRLVSSSRCLDYETNSSNDQNEWDRAQAHVKSALDRLSDSELHGTKRGRDDNDVASGSTVPTDAPSSKKAKKDALSSETDDSGDDPAIFTLHAISVTSPIRKKADITVHKHSLRFTNPSNASENLCPPIPISTLRHAFLVDTPGKAKPHHTVVILPDAGPAEKSEHPQVIFGVDANPTTVQITTKYPAPRQTHAKGAMPSKQLIHSLFAYFPQGEDGLVDLYEPKPVDFKSSSGSQSVDAHIAAKDGHVYFFNKGLLWGEKKPCMWFGVDDIESCETRSATGRSFSLFVSTRVPGADEEEEEDEIETIEFSLIDAKESDAVGAWIAKHKAQFAAASASPSAPTTSMAGQSKNVLSAPTMFANAVLDSDDEDDDFDASSGSSDGGSARSSSSESDDEGEEAEEAEAEDSGDELEELDESKHPLMKPGAVPRMSKAAMKAAVGMVEEEFGM